MGQRKNIAVLYGGYSGESVISEQSARMMMDSLKSAPLDLYPVLVDHEGMHVKTLEGTSSMGLSDFSAKLPQGNVYMHAALIAIHGTPGEDGKLQGYLDMVGIPYTTGDVLNMALTFNKAATNLQLKQLGFRVAACVLLMDPSEVDIEKILGKVGLPCFVKPNNGGSSLGMSKVKETDDLAPAIKKAFVEDDQVLVEAFLPGREITCGVIPRGGSPFALPPLEVRTPNEFFDFEAKYSNSKTEEIVPAPIPQEMTYECQRIALRIYRALNCRGMARVDMMMYDDRFSVIEVNTVPGFSKASIVPKMLVAAGIDPGEVLQEMIARALGS